MIIKEILNKIFCKPVRNRNILLLFMLLYPASGINGMTIKADTTNSSAKDLKMKAIRSERNNDIFKAIEYYQRYLEFVPNDVELTYRLESLLIETRDYVNASHYIDVLIGLNARKYPVAWYHKGIACMSLGKYTDAVEAFAKFKKYYHSKDSRHNYRKLAVIFSAACEWSEKNSDPDGKIIVSHPGGDLNHSDIEFSPFPVDETNIMFGAVYSDPSKHIEPIRQIYKAELLNGKWKTTGLLGGEINDPEYNSGNAVLSDDGQRLFFTRARKNWQGKLISEIYLSYLIDNEWQTPVKLPYPVNNENYTSTQPTLGRNLRTGSDILYFISDRPGGKGGLDIWYSEYDKKEKKFRDPVDLSNRINTIGDECSPFFDISSLTLYFSSNGRKESLGGFDIYKTTGSARKWTDVIPMPAPINSSYDDYYYSIFRNNREGFFSSNRPESTASGNATCCDDIFTFKYYDCVKIHASGVITNSMNHEFYDGLKAKYHFNLDYPPDNAALEDVPVELYLKAENDNDMILISQTFTDNKGSYSFELDKDKNYEILVKNFGYSEKKVSMNTIKKDCTDTLSFGITSIKYLPKISIQLSIYYDFNDSHLNDTARLTIDRKVMPLFDIFPEGIIEIGSHTDNVGTDEYNINLSQKRSESVVSYIISKGISPERLVAKGYGMRIPVALNNNPDGSDNPEGRQLNRRTEIKVVGQVSASTDE